MCVQYSNYMINLVNSQAFDEYEEKALSKVKNKTYQSEISIKRKKKQFAMTKLEMDK